MATTIAFKEKLNGKLSGFDIYDSRKLTPPKNVNVDKVVKQ